MNRQNHASQKPDPVHPKIHLLKAVLAAQRRSFQDFFRSLPVSWRHALFVLNGERRGSAKLLDAMRKALGPAGWSYATGATNVLEADAPPTAEAQP